MSVHDELFPCHRCINIGILNLMPSADREVTEQMYPRRFEGFPLPVRIIWMHPEADKPDFKHTTNRYVVPSQEIYDQIDHLFRTGADVEFVKPEDNRFLECLRESRSFDKGSTSLCWSAAQMYADDTGQEFSDLLIGKDEKDNYIKRSGYFDYEITDMLRSLRGNATGAAWMASSRHFEISADEQLQIARDAGYEAVAISKIRSDIGSVVKGRDLLLFNHIEYPPRRLYDEAQRDIARNPAKAESLRAKFNDFRTAESAADQFGQTVFQAILKQIADWKYGRDQVRIPALQRTYG